MGRNSSRRNQSQRFTPSEMKQMERFLEANDGPLDQNIYQRLAQKINLASIRTGKRVLQWKQVEKWIQSKQKNQATKVTSLDMVSKELAAASNVCPSICTPESSSEMSKGEADNEELEFEARSSRDGAWYDVGAFLSHRFLDGELEALVRYQDFGADEDEWVNVKKAVRQRSIPIDSNECQRVAVGDLLICYREKDDQACYFDAHVAEIQRKIHDIRGCRCRFLIRFEHDQTEETVQLGRLCRRP